MTYVLDSTLIIDHANGTPGAAATLKRLFEEGEVLMVCDVIVCESLSAGDDEQREVVARLLGALEYVSIPPEAARWAGISRRTRERSSPRTVGDALIAGVAWFLNATIVTRNPRDFEAQGVPVLRYG